jgi:polyisoprenoid-binding protein YceI
MKNRLVICVALACAALTPASGAQWNVDHAKSRLWFSVLWSGQTFEATFKTWKADIQFDPADLSHSHANVTIDLNSEASAAPDNDDGLKGAEGFAVTQFPTARFETTNFTAKGGNNYLAMGRLTLHGVSKTITLPFALVFSGDSAHMTGKTVVLRTDFALGKGEWASASTIAHEVAITVDLTATKSH